MAPCSTSRLDLAPERRNAFPHPNRPAAGQYVLDLRTRSFDVSCLVLCFFGLHLPLLLPLSDTLLASLLSLTFLSCQHSQALNQFEKRRRKLCPNLSIRCTGQ